MPRGRIENGSCCLTSLDRPARLFALVLTAIAGYVDGAGFLMSGGYFVSFMSGNSTRLGVGLGRDTAEAAMAAGLVASFVAGVVAGASLRRLAKRAPHATILGVLAASLALSGYFATLGWQQAATLILAASMGLENTIFAEAGEVRVGLTYMTGALVRVGKGLTAAVFREDSSRWTPPLLLWLSLIAGATLGAAAYSSFGVAALWTASAALAALTPISLLVFAPQPATD